eukprot:6183413-Pleurochrysis_carterae.AAC.1
MASQTHAHAADLPRGVARCKWRAEKLPQTSRTLGGERLVVWCVRVPAVGVALVALRVRAVCGSRLVGMFCAKALMLKIGGGEGTARLGRPRGEESASRRGVASEGCEDFVSAESFMPLEESGGACGGGPAADGARLDGSSACANLAAARIRGGAKGVAGRVRKGEPGGFERGSRAGLKGGAGREKQRDGGLACEQGGEQGRERRGEEARDEGVVQRAGGRMSERESWRRVEGDQGNSQGSVARGIMAFTDAKMCIQGRDGKTWEESGENFEAEAYNSKASKLKLAN